MNPPPLVSILIRSMDRATLQRALDSVAAQDYPNIEVIVVAASGAAHRDLPARCGAFALTLIRSSQRLARAYAANAALDAARGEWLNILDDDDEILPTHVSRLRAALDANPTVRLAHSISEDRGNDGQVIGHHGGRFKPWRQLDTGFFRLHCAMFARSLLDEGARFDTRFDILEDMDFFIQSAALTPFLFVDAVTARYYVDAGESGAGSGTNHDHGRLDAAFGLLRTKWAELERTLRATPEFRAENALWLIENGAAGAAAPMVAQLLAENPDSVEARTLRALEMLSAGNNVHVRQMLADIGARLPAIETLAARLDAMRAQFATRH